MKVVLIAFLLIASIIFHPTLAARLMKSKIDIENLVIPIYNSKLSIIILTNSSKYLQSQNIGITVFYPL